MFSLFSPSSTNDVIALFTAVFSASEGRAEGQLIGELVSSLVSTTPPGDLIGCIATDDRTDNHTNDGIDHRIVGCIFFSRFTLPSNQRAFILSPVAIATDVQGHGIGQQLIRYGLDHLKSLQVDLAFTYGDSAFYSKTGFKQISASVVNAPFELSQPEGWLAQSLSGQPIQKIQGATQCVAALSDQKYW